MERARLIGRGRCGRGLGRGLRMRAWVMLMHNMGALSVGGVA